MLTSDVSVCCDPYFVCKGFFILESKNEITAGITTVSSHQGFSLNINEQSHTADGLFPFLPSVAATYGLSHVYT